MRLRPLGNGALLLMVWYNSIAGACAENCVATLVQNVRAQENVALGRLDRASRVIDSPGMLSLDKARSWAKAQNAQLVLE